LEKGQKKAKGDVLSALDNKTVATANTDWVMENLSVGLVVLDIGVSGYKIAVANRFFKKHFGVDMADYIGAPLESIPDLPVARPIISQCELVCASQKPAAFEWQYNTAPNEQFFSCNLVPRINEAGEVYQIMGTITDRSSEKRAEKNLLYNALHDPLTELPNRILFQEYTEDALSQHQESGNRHCAILICNVDRFQMINETLGHMAGDEFLIAFAARLKRSVRPQDQLARLNGDEFGFLIHGVENLEEVEAIAARIHKSLIEPFQLGDSEFFVSVSVGISTTISSLPYPEELIRDADFAMHRAKAGGRAKSEVYRRSTSDEARNQFLLEIELRKAVDNKELQLHYQPIVDLNSGKMTSFEALARWFHPELGFIPPDQFIPIAEQSRIIVDLGSWAMIEACRQLKQWREEVPRAADLGITVNVSNAQFLRTNVAKDAAVALDLSGLPGEALRLELTETVIMENPVQAVGYLNEVKKLNVGLALDDFGTGYSSLGSLQNFPLDILKIDRSFVSDIETNQSNLKICEIITQLSHTFGFAVVAEGIEELEHIKILRRLGCQYGQGFYISKPLNVADATAFINKKLAF
jgi:diguanylate cyclase (GGDEF)-like protein